MLLVVAAERIRLRAELLRGLSDWSALHTESTRLLQLGNCDWAIFEDYFDAVVKIAAASNSDDAYSGARVFLASLSTESAESARSTMFAQTQLAFLWTVMDLVESSWTFTSPLVLRVVSMGRVFNSYLSYLPIISTVGGFFLKKSFSNSTIWRPAYKPTSSSLEANQDPSKNPGRL